MPGSRFVKCKKNEIGASFNFWELNGDELHRFNEVNVREGALKLRKGALKVGSSCVKVRKGVLKVR